MIGPISLPGNRCGRLEIEPYPAAAIVPTNETLTALQGNVLQAIHAWPDYASGRLQTGPLRDRSRGEPDRPGMRHPAFHTA